MRFLLAVAGLALGVARAQITANPPAVSFGAYVQGQAVPSQTITVTSTVAWRATPGATWLSVTPQSGAISSTPISLKLAVATASLPVGSQPTTTSLVIAPSGTSATSVPAVTVNITITYLPLVVVNRTAFSFNALPGQTPPVQTFSITTNDAANAAWTITPAVTTPRLGTWLNVSTRAGSGNLDTVILLINTASLSVGSYAGTITVTPGAPAAPIVLAVNLAITSGVPNVSLSSPYFSGGPNLNFAGSTAAPQNFTLLNTGGSQFSWSLATSTVSGGGWLLASPKSGTSATTVTVAVNGVSLAAGAYSGVITITIPGAVVPTLRVNVTYTISPTTPLIAAAGVVNAATFLPGPISPGQLITIFGANLANGAAATAPEGNLLPIVLGATSVTIGGFAAPLIYVSPTQINAQVPYEVAVPTAQVIVNVAETSGQPVVVSVAAASPGIFSVDGTGTGTATIVRNSDFSLITAGNRARRGEVVAIFATGLGHVVGGGITGMLVTSPAAATAAVGVNFGATGATVTYAGLALGFVGLYQVNAVVPQVSGGASGSVQVTLRAGSVSSPALATFVAAQTR